MPLKQWKLQDAKNRLSELVETAIKEGPQEITKYGEHAVVVISFALFQALNRPKENLVEFLKKSPLYGLELDLKRVKDVPRETEF